jgi:ABC-2 type transport system ATP-binding protein
VKLVVDNITRTFGRTKALDGVSFTMEPGRVSAFVGPNGAGKTTTMRIIATLDTPTTGDVSIDGFSVTEYPERTRKLVGFMPDALPAHGDIVVHEYLDFFARAFGVRQPARSQILGEIEDFTGLGPLREKTLKSLSKGMKQRVSLARALVHDPAVLILDEPAAGLDPHARIELRELIVALAKRGKAILISSHILHELEEMVDDVIIVQRGRVIRAGAIDAIAHGEADPAAPNGTNAAATPAPAAARRILVRLLSGHEDFPALVALQPGVTACRARGSRAFELDIEADDQGTAALLQSLVAAGVPLVEFRMASGGLERMFLEATRGNGSAT